MGQVEQWAVAVIADPCGQICVHRGMDSVREFPEEVGDEVHMPRAKQSAIWNNYVSISKLLDFTQEIKFILYHLLT